jgi:hypothetical protein
MGAPDDNDRPSKGLEDLTVSELTLAIEETILNKEDKRIARLRFVELETIERIAEAMMLDKRTVQKRLIRIFPRVVWTVQKLLR